MRFHTRTSLTSTRPPYDGPVIAARFKDLCMDAGDAPRLGRFWAGALGGTLTEREGGVCRIDPPPGHPDTEAMWINPVPEPRVGKTRVHLDLRLAAPDPGPLVELGAEIVRTPGDDPWWVLADPERNLFRALPPGAGTTPGPFELIVDCRDAAAAEARANWWAGLVGGTVETAEDGSASITGAAGLPWHSWVFDPVPEPKTVKNRAHWDLMLTAPAPDALIEAGATLLRSPDDDISWWILRDPEGNEFCAFAPEEAPADPVGGRADS